MPVAEVAQAAIPVSVHGVTLTGAGVWTLVLIALGYLIRAWPQLKKLSIERESGLDASRAADMAAMRADIAAARAEAKEASDHCHRMETRLVAAVAAVQLLTAELRLHDKDSPAIRQAQELIVMATTGDFAMGKALEQLASMSGTRKP